MTIPEPDAELLERYPRAGRALLGAAGAYMLWSALKTARDAVRLLASLRRVDVAELAASAPCADCADLIAQAVPDEVAAPELEPDDGAPVAEP